MITNSVNISIVLTCQMIQYACGDGKNSKKQMNKNSRQLNTFSESVTYNKWIETIFAGKWYC